MEAPSGIRRLQKYVYSVLEVRRKRNLSSRIFNWFLLALISLNVLAFIVETIEPIGERYAAFFDFFLLISILFFSVEYVLRLWTCTLIESGIYRHPVKGRLRYLLSPLALVDLLAIAPFYLGAIIGADLRFLRLFRLLWILKVSRFLPAMTTLGRVLIRERTTLASVLAIMVIMLFIASSLVYLLEREIQPVDFASIPDAIWWGVATLTTVGYGDIVPQSPMGRVLGVVIMLLGIGTFALPAGILASAFSEESKRRDFIVAWDLVARVPFFSRLNATDIAEISTLLHPRSAMANEVIFRKDEEAESMFFIVSGEVEAQTEPEPIRLGKGDFFGEVALLYHRKRTASVVALCSTELLELDAKDYHRVFRTKPKLRQQISDEAEKRLFRTPPEALEGELEEDEK